MSNIKEAITAAFDDVEEILRGKIRLEDGFSANKKLTYDSRLRHSYAGSVCEVVLADVEKARIKHTVNAERVDAERAEGETVSAAGFKALAIQRIEASPLFKNYGEDGFFIQDFIIELIGNMPECNLPDVVTCRECKHGQQNGTLGVLCEYGGEEYRPYEHFCAWAERRAFDENIEE